jgi:hypothetical protein
MQDREWIPGEDLFVESLSPENSFGVVFEDDGEAAYFYALDKDKDGAGVEILDALHIYEGDGEVGKPARVQVVWSRDWLKCALVIDGQCHALFDFEAQGGYSINEFPPPNGIWTRGDRKLTEEIVKRLF